MALITFEQAVRQCRLEGVEEEHTEALLMKMAQAEALILRYIGDEVSDEWTDATTAADDAVFPVVQAAILEVLSNLMADRGDREKPTVGPITERVTNMLQTAGLRVPILA